MKITDVTGVLRCKVAVCGEILPEICRLYTPPFSMAIIPGDAAVGKTSLISMYTSKGKKFPSTYTMVRWWRSVARLSAVSGIMGSDCH